MTDKESEVIIMTNIENIKKEIEQRETSIKEMEEKLKEAKKELKKFEKYRGLNFDAYHNYGGGKYHKGLARECFVDALRKLVLYMAGTTKYQFPECLPSCKAKCPGSQKPVPESTS